MMRPCKGIAEVEAEDSVRMTRARTALAATTSVSKKRKVDGGKLELSTSLVKHETRTSSVTSPENSDAGNSTCESISSDHDLASCCSSNESSEVVKGNSKFADLQEENEIGAVESTVSPREANSRSRSSRIQKMLSEAELAEFFAAAEKDHQKQFTDKYNFDILEDKPLEGRYEWIELNSQQGCTDTEIGNATRVDI